MYKHTIIESTNSCLRRAVLLLRESVRIYPEGYVQLSHVAILQKPKTLSRSQVSGRMEFASLHIPLVFTRFSTILIILISLLIS